MNIKLKIGLIALLIIIFQSILKLVGVIITGSLSFLSETIDTLVDIFFVSLTLYSIYVSQKPADYEHMYGHAKIDSIGALTQGIILVTVYVLLISNAIQTIISQNFIVENPSIGLQLLIISIATNLIFSRILIWQGRKRNSLSLEIQGLNLFQDSLRAIIVIINFIIVVLFDIIFLDPIFSIIVSFIIIVSALRLTKEGIDDLIDVNPVNTMVIKILKQEISNLEHVNDLIDLRIRGSGNKIFLEVNLAVEDHISIIHANEISKAIKRMAESNIPNYNIETVIEMNPLSSENSLGEKIINIIYSLKINYPKILDVKDLNIFQFESEYFLSFSTQVEKNLTLNEAHNITTEYENELKKQIPEISRIITRIETKKEDDVKNFKDKVCKKLRPEESEELKNKIESILRSKEYVKGYHGFEFWNIKNYCLIEIHIFFDGGLNIAVVHNYISELEDLIQTKVEIHNLKKIILHSEPLTGRTDGIKFER